MRTKVWMSGDVRVCAPANSEFWVTFLLLNIYAPNKTPNQCNFFDKLNNNRDEYAENTERELIVGGYFDVPLNPNFDWSAGNPSIKDAVKNIQSVIQWSYILYNNISICVLNNGYSTSSSKWGKYANM